MIDRISEMDYKLDIPICGFLVLCGKTSFTPCFLRNINLYLAQLYKMFIDINREILED
jgi:hypothetical protein